MAKRRCRSCSYTEVQVNDVGPHFKRWRCLNPHCPKRPACPACGSTAVHKQLLLAVECRGCGEVFRPRDAEAA